MNYRKMIVLGMIVAVLGGVSALLLWQIEKPLNFVWDHGFSYETFADKTIESYEEVLPEDESMIKTLDIKVASTDVTIVRGHKFKITSSNLLSDIAKSSISVSFSQGRVTIQEHTEKPVRLALNFSPKLTIEIPDDQKLASIKAQSKDGDIKVSNLKSIHQMSATTITGDLDYEDVILAQLETQTNSGDMTFEDVRVTQLNANSESGDMALKDSQITGQGQMTNQSGDITLKSSRIPVFYVTTETGEKDIDEEMRSKVTTKDQAKLLLTTRSGDIAVD